MSVVTKRIRRSIKTILAGALLLVLAPVLRFVVGKETDDNGSGLGKILSVPNAHADTPHPGSTAGDGDGWPADGFGSSGDGGGGGGGCGGDGGGSSSGGC